MRSGLAIEMRNLVEGRSAWGLAQYVDQIVIMGPYFY